MNEKERVYGELDATRKRVFHLRREVKLLRSRGTAADAARMRAEAERYRKALSNIWYRYEKGALDDAVLLRIVDRALRPNTSRTKSVYQRENRERDERVQALTRRHGVTVSTGAFQAPSASSTLAGAIDPEPVQSHPRSTDRESSCK